MSALRFVGGDANDPVNYELTCKCKAVLGQLGRFSVNPEGWRSIMCGRCQSITYINGIEIKHEGPIRVEKLNS